LVYFLNFIIQYL